MRRVWISAVAQLLFLLGARGVVLAHGPGPIVPTPTPAMVLGVAESCPGDCNGDGIVSVDELVTGVSIALGSRPLTDCEAFDVDGNGQVGVDVLVLAVAAALGDCAGATATATPTPEGTPSILSAWILNSEDERSQHIFTDSSRTTGVLVNVESATLETIAGESYAVVRASGIPSYEVTLSQDDIDTLNNRPLANRDFRDGQTTAVAGAPIEFGADIGFHSAQANCDTTGGAGYWPPGPVCPIDWAKVGYFPVVPAPNETGTRCETGLGADGYWVNGVSLFNWYDGQTFENRGVWQNIAPKFELYDLDICAGHSARGEYHHHSDPKCLAEQLGDDGHDHSPTYGYAADGYPVYGPWVADGVLAKSSWVARDYDDPDSPTGCGVAGKRTCLLVDQYDVSKGTVPAASAGPDVGEKITTLSGNEIEAVSGVYFQDYYFDADLAARGGEYLDEHNGHFDEERGYHYHVTAELDEETGELTYVFPGTIGPSYYGVLHDNAVGRCGLNLGPR